MLDDPVSDLLREPGPISELDVLAIDVDVRTDRGVSGDAGRCAFRHGVTSSKMSRHDVYDEQNSLTILVAIELHGDDLQLAVAFVAADLAPTVVA